MFNSMLFCNLYIQEIVLDIIYTFERHIYEVVKIYRNGIFCVAQNQQSQADSMFTTAEDADRMLRLELRYWSLNTTNNRTRLYTLPVDYTHFRICGQHQAYQQ